MRIKAYCKRRINEPIGIECSFELGHFKKVGVPYHKDGLELEDALLLVNRWNTISGKRGGTSRCQYWLEVEDDNE